MKKQKLAILLLVFPNLFCSFLDKRIIKKRNLYERIKKSLLLVYVMLQLNGLFYDFGVYVCLKLITNRSIYFVIMMMMIMIKFIICSALTCNLC